MEFCIQWREFHFAIDEAIPESLGESIYTTESLLRM